MIAAIVASLLLAVMTGTAGLLVIAIGRAVCPPPRTPATAPPAGQEAAAPPAASEVPAPLAPLGAGASPFEPAPPPDGPEPPPRPRRSRTGHTEAIVAAYRLVPLFGVAACDAARWARAEARADRLDHPGPDVAASRHPGLDARLAELSARRELASA